MLITSLSFSLLVVAAAEPLVRGLRKLPEDIDWSYSGVYETFVVCAVTRVCHVDDVRDRKWNFWVCMSRDFVKRWHPESKTSIYT